MCPVNNAAVIRELRLIAPFINTVYQRANVLALIPVGGQVNDETGIRGEKN